MKKMFEIIRIVGISVESLWIVIVFALFSWERLWLIYLGRNLLASDDTIKWLTGVSTALLGSVVFTAFKLTEPRSERDAVLHQWPDYWRLAYRRNVGIVWCGCAVVLASVPLVFRKELPLEWIGGLCLAAVGLSIISASSLLFSVFTLKHIVVASTGD